MARHALAILVAGAAAELLLPTPARACGATAPPFYVVKDQAPASDATPLNAPLVITLEADPNGPADPNFNPSLTLMESDSDVPVELESLGGLPTLTWRPNTSLEPETQYEAHFNPGYEGIPDTIWTFTTGTESTPTLSLEGELAVTFEPGTDTVFSCPAGGGIGCDGTAGCTSEVVAVTKARVKIPHAIAGFMRRSGALWLTDDLPYQFSPESKTSPAPYHGANVSRVEYVDLDDLDLREALITVPDGERRYQPCFAFAASDARGDQATSAPLCVDLPAKPEPIQDQGDPGFLDGAERAPNPAASSSRTSKGCGFSPQRTGHGHWLAALALCGLVRRRTRRLSAAPRP